MEADRLAKLAVAEHKVSQACVEQWGLLKAAAARLAKWEARAADLANNRQVCPQRVSDQTLGPYLLLGGLDGPLK